MVSHYTTNMLPTPARFQSLFDGQKRIAQGIESLALQTQDPNLRTRMSICQTQPASRSRRSHSRTKQNVKTFRVRYTVCNNLLGFFVEASLNITTRAGVFGIGSRLVFRAVVSDSPAFRVIGEAVEVWFRNESRMSEGREFAMLIKETHVKLLRLFQDGKASPSDMDPHGNTALHVSVTT